MFANTKRGRVNCVGGCEEPVEVGKRGHVSMAPAAAVVMMMVTKMKMMRMRTTMMNIPRMNSWRAGKLLSCWREGLAACVNVILHEDPMNLTVQLLLLFL